MKKMAYMDQLCERCKSKRRISKTWKEKVPTFSGSVMVEYSQIVCTNKECQKLFDENLAKETKQRETLRLQKEEKDSARKANSLLQASKSRKKVKK